MFLYCDQCHLVTNHFVVPEAEGDFHTDLYSICQMCGVERFREVFIVDDKNEGTSLRK